VTDLLDKVFKKKNLAFYSLNQARDFDYIVSDLRPSLIVIDSQTALTFKTELKFQIDHSENLKTISWIILGDSHELDFIPHQLGQIQRPFDPFHVPDLIEKIIKSNRLN
jgi:hypothetical protein